MRFFTFSFSAPVSSGAVTWWDRSGASGSVSVGLLGSILGFPYTGIFQSF